MTCLDNRSLLARPTKGPNLDQSDTRSSDMNYRLFSVIQTESSRVLLTPDQGPMNNVHIPPNAGPSVRNSPAPDTPADFRTCLDWNPYTAQHLIKAGHVFD